MLRCPFFQFLDSPGLSGLLPGAQGRSDIEGGEEKNQGGDTMLVAGPVVGGPGDGSNAGGSIGEEGQEYKEGCSRKPVTRFLDRVEGGNENRPAEKDARCYHGTEIFGCGGRWYSCDPEGKKDDGEEEAQGVHHESGERRR